MAQPEQTNGMDTEELRRRSKSLATLALLWGCFAWVAFIAVAAIVFGTVFVSTALDFESRRLLLSLSPVAGLLAFLPCWSFSCRYRREAEDAKRRAGATFANQATEQEKVSARETQIGCALLVIIVPLIGIWYASIPEITTRSISGSTGYIDTKTTTGETPAVKGYMLAREVYEFAAENPSLDKIVIRMKFVLGELYVDKYGYKVKGERDMGFIPISGLDEVRRYRDASAYAHARQDGYAFMISQLEYSNLMGK